MNHESQCAASDPGATRSSKPPGNLDEREFGDINTLTVREYQALSAWRKFCYRIYRHPLALFVIGPFTQFVIKHRFPFDIPFAWKREWASALWTNVALAGLSVGLAALVGWEAWRARTPRGAAAGSARVLLAFLLFVNPWVLPWYFSWPLAFGLVAGWETRTARVALLFSLTAPAVMHYVEIWGWLTASSFNVVYLAPLLLPILPRLLRPDGVAPESLARSAQVVETATGKGIRAA